MSKTDAEGGVSSKTYDADGRLIKVINEEGAQTHYIYDDCGRIVKMTDARGGVTSYAYTDRGDVATETNAEGYTISYEYDGRHNMVKKTTVDGSTTYVYDALDRLVSITTPDGKTETFEYNGEGKIISSTDKGGHKTRYILDANGNIIETIDAMGNSALFEYDSMNNLIKTSMYRVDIQDNVDEWEITLYEFDGRGLVTREVKALGDITTYVYDGNGNIKTKTDSDGKVTAYVYNGLDMITSINYNGGKQVSYRFNKVGDLVEMNDWTGKTSFEVDLLNRITRTTDTKGKVVEYNYDETGNQTLVKYPDNTTAAKTYDLLGNLKSVTETDGRTTRYTYDGMNRISKMEYPHGWVEDYQYDSVGQLLNITDTDPSNNDMKQQKHAYTYDDCGNMTYEYMRGNGTGEATVENTYTYDALHRVISAHENYGNKTRTYQYDSLGNLTYETELGNKSIDYKFNNLNQITTKTEDGWNTQNDFTYDRRGNLIQETYTKNSKISVTGEYTYDETNKMVLGVNELGESSAHLYNGLGALVENTWVIKKNAYGYHDVSALTNMVAGEVVVDPQTGKKDKKDKLAPEVVAASPELNKTSTVVKQFVVDYTSETFEPLMEYEINSLEYRYVYGNDRLSVNITGVDTSSGNLIEKVNQIRMYYHMDYLGAADYLTSPMTGKVEGWTHYNEWGEITHNAVLKCGQRELDMVKRYATHDYDSVLSVYYAKARFYDAEDRRFTAIDPILDGSIYALTFYAKNHVQFVQYLYVKNNPIIYIDQLGKKYTLAEGTMAHATIQTYISSQYEVTIIDKYVYGLTRTTSGKGRPDVVIKNENIYHVYEIKSEEYMGNKRSSKSAFNQLESYVDALKNHPELNTERYTNSSTAQKGTILKWDSHIILPYLADRSKVLEAWTKESNPGMIIYEIRSKKKEDKVKDESFVTESLLNTIRYYAMIACENPPEAKLNLVNVDTYSDKQLNNDIIDWLNDVKIVTTSYGTEVEFPDGKAYYYNPMFPLDMPRISSNSYKELLKIYDGQERRWVNRNTLGDSNTVIPVIPVVPNVPTISLPIFGPSGILVFP